MGGWAVDMRFEFEMCKSVCDVYCIRVSQNEPHVPLTVSLWSLDVLITRKREYGNMKQSLNKGGAPKIVNTVTQNTLLRKQWQWHNLVRLILKGFMWGQHERYWYQRSLSGTPGISLAVDLYRLTIVFGSSNVCLVNVVAAASQRCVFLTLGCIKKGMPVCHQQLWTGGSD